MNAAQMCGMIKRGGVGSPVLFLLRLQTISIPFFIAIHLRPGYTGRNEIRLPSPRSSRCIVRRLPDFMRKTGPDQIDAVKHTAATGPRRSCRVAADGTRAARRGHAPGP